MLSIGSIVIRPNVDADGSKFEGGQGLVADTALLDALIKRLHGMSDEKVAQYVRSSLALCGDFNEVLWDEENHGGHGRSRREDFQAILEQSWVVSSGRGAVVHVVVAIQNCTKQLSKWNARNRVSMMANIKSKQEELRKETTCIQSNNWEQIRRIENQLDCLLLEEEVYWRQRSRTEWLRGGDRNTKIFHMKASARTRNEILGLFRDEGSWCVGNQDMEIVVVGYFVKLFDSKECPREDMDQGVMYFSDPGNYIEEFREKRREKQEDWEIFSLIFNINSILNTVCNL
ncbi:hypothetical protein Dsin_013955 [Dipteronia sinensis]|uniref:Uncharacterized protein n=1 Tax=Dipteronia sinensis TaxID=43782 RepID=A0AAE0EB37_9ROSI|nr:hypothetical protein Dsin_013955 [Dipteronia sinensis]